MKAELRTPLPDRAPLRGSTLEVRGVSQAYGAVGVLHDLSLTVEPGSLTTILGSSGSGKTTLLKVIAGLIEPSSGRILLDGHDVTTAPINKRNIGFVFQNYALFPHLNVRANVEFSLSVRGIDRAERARRADEALDRVRLRDFGSRFPGELSGGQQQRVSLARAIVFNPTILLMDEPLGSLDKQLREVLQIEIRRLQQELHITTIYVTHDQDEAFALSDAIVLMRDGYIAQMGSPFDVYNSPANSFIANFMGELNEFDATVLSRGGSAYAQSRTNDIRFVSDRALPEAKEVKCGIRPHHVAIAPRSSSGTENCVAGEVAHVTFRGIDQRIVVVLGDGTSMTAQFRADTVAPEVGSQVMLHWQPEHVLVLTG